MPNVYDPTQSQGLSLEDLIDDPEFLSLLGKVPFANMNAQMPEGMRVGGTYRAAHPLQAVATIGERVLGGLNQKRLNDAMARILRSRRPAAAEFGGGTTPEELIPPQEY